MKITIYDRRYSLSQHLYHSEYFENVEPFNIHIAELTPEMAAFGWLESLSDSDIDLGFLDLNYTFIKFER